MTVKIRPIKITDAKDIAKYLFDRMDEKSVSEQIKENLIIISEGSMMRYVAVINDKVIGQSLVIINPSPIKQHVAEIYGMVVANDYQGKGVSSILMNICIGWARKKNCEIVTISVRKGTKAELVYKHMGFTVIGELKSGIKESWGEKNVYDELFMYKNI